MHKIFWCFSTYHFVTARPLDEINECTYDPPGVLNGTRPTFMDGATVKTLIGEREPESIDVEYGDQVTGPSKYQNCLSSFFNLIPADPAEADSMWLLTIKAWCKKF